MLLLNWQLSGIVNHLTKYGMKDIMIMILIRGKRKMKKCVCKRCGYRWNARVRKPKECPECKRRDWNKTRGQ